MILRNFNVERVETNPAKIREMKSQGWIVVYDEAANIEVAEAPKNYAGMLKADLVKEAAAKGIATKGMTKAAIIEALERE